MTPRGILGMAVLIVIGIFVYSAGWNITTSRTGATLMAFSDAKGFWRGEVKFSEPDNKGYLLTQQSIPLRAIARRPNVPMFSNIEAAPGESIQQVMQPWKPYYVYEYNAAKGALRIGEKAREQGPALWVLEGDVYCWTTREVLNIERPVPIYASLDDARADTNRLKDSYTFTYSAHATTAEGRSRLATMAALPVLRKEEGKFVSFIRPDPEPQSDQDRPYQVGWIRWDGSDDTASVRLRITRPEFEEYMRGLQQLLYDYRYGSPDERTTARKAITGEAQTVATGEEEKAKVRSLDANKLQERTAGIPHPSGILLTSITTELQAENISNRLLESAKLGNDRSVWDRSEIAYIEVDKMP